MQDTPAPAPAPGPQPPENPFEPFAPSDAEPWNARRIGHLLRRVAFGANSQRMQTCREKGPGPAVDWLFEFDPKSDVGGLNAFLKNATGLYDIRQSPVLVAQWWFHRMMHTPAPLQERLAVMWHDHFATSASKVGAPTWMHDQIELFRTHGQGHFKELLVTVGRQPAMLRWLDGHGSHKDHPNENYAREVLELFSLGVGHYTEDDVLQLAKAFTGWLITGAPMGVFDQNRWDPAEKTVLGKTGPYNDEQAVDVIMQHPQCSKYVAWRLLTSFVHPEPRPEHVDHYAARLVALEWNIGNTLKEMLKSRLFFSDWAYRSMIKSPVDLCVGAAIAVGGVPRAEFLRQRCAAMGQSLLYPPDVSGWKGGQSWINANTVMVRFSYGMELARQGFGEFAEGPLYQDLEARQITTSAKIVNHFADLLLDGEIPMEARGRFLDYMNRDTKNQPAEFAFDPGFVQQKVRGLIQLMMSMPQYQLA